MNWIGLNYKPVLFIIVCTALALVQFDVVFVNGHTDFFDWVDDKGQLKSSVVDKDFDDKECVKKYADVDVCWAEDTFLCKNQTFESCLSDVDGQVVVPGAPGTTVQAETRKIETLIMDGQALASIRDEHVDIATKDLRMLYVWMRNGFKQADLVRFLYRSPKLKDLVLSLYNSDLCYACNNFTLDVGNRTDTYSVENVLMIGSSAMMGKWLSLSKLTYLNVAAVYMYPDAPNFDILPMTLKKIDLGNSLMSRPKVLESLKHHQINTLGMANSYLQLQIPSNLSLFANTLQYLTMASNFFNLNHPASRNSSTNFSFPKLPELLELDLRSCSITWLPARLFANLPKLQKVSLAKNSVIFAGELFTSLGPVKLVDLSMNPSVSYIKPDMKYNMRYETVNENPLTHFVDLSYTNSFCIHNLNDSLSRVTHLSLACSKNCYNWMNFTLLRQLKVLDLSSISDTVLSYKLTKEIFGQLPHVPELHFRANGLTLHDSNETFDLFLSLKSIKVLHLGDNYIKYVPKGLFTLLERLESLNLSNNAIVGWNSGRLFRENYRLRRLDISSNQVVSITEDMRNDFMNLTELNLLNNPLICNEQLAYLVCSSNSTNEYFRLKNYEQTTCFDQSTGSYKSLPELGPCMKSLSDGIDDVDVVKKKLPYQVVVLVIIMICMCLVVVARKWWTITYYVKVFRLTKIASFFRKRIERTDCDFRYDVFVSYSENDRSWVLDDLMPYLETKSGMHICLHERDFKIGLGIMENIMECMYTSHCLLLVISPAFVKSKWCQFEMHLGQYFLVETSKPHLILVFLEQIPKCNRPKILHYLMKTRTYIEWPGDVDRHAFTEERSVFFKRLSYALQQFKNF